MRFEHPQILWLLLVVPPALVLFFWWASRQRQKLLEQFIQARLLSTLTVGISPARKKIRFGCLVFAVALLVITLARPQRGFDLQEVEQHGLDIVVAVDTSKSMLATDIAPNRLTRARLAALELMQKAGTDRMGLVAFAGDAFLECPLTIDNTAFQQCVQALDVNAIPQGGTAIAAAINTALTAFKEGNHHKVLVLFTDGEDNDTGALEAAQNAAKAGLKIFTIGIGTAGGDLLRVTDANGNSDYVRDEQGNVVKSHLNEALLQQIAGATDGFYLPLRGANTIDTLYERGLAPLPKSEGRERLVRRYHEQFHWPLALAMLLLLAEMFLPERRSLPRRLVSTKQSEGGSFRAKAGPTRREPDGGLKRAGPEAGVPIAMLVALLGLAVCGNASASPSSALREYKSGYYTNALQEFERLAQANTNDLRLIFNAGTAAYRATNFDTALNDFQAATLSPDLKLQQQAYYNLGNTQYRAGTTAEDLDGLQEAWEAATNSFNRAVKLDKNDLDATNNLGFVTKQIGLIAKLREAARRAKEAADEATRRRNYHQALEIMTELFQKNPTAKQFEEFAKRLKEIDEIAPSPQP
ncbi:MAG: VWA domain-containing protein [Verrucomicrobiota bacterium]|jgi:Ca-activated chloride channel family protein